MSKPVGTITLSLDPDEAVVVLEKKFWDHMVHWYTIMENDTFDPIEKANWKSVATAVEQWVERTHFDPKKVDDMLEDEWDD